MTRLDLLVRNVRIVDVFRLRIVSGWVGVAEGRFVFAEPASEPCPSGAVQKIDGGGRYLVPGLIDAHMHIESSLLTPRRFAEAAVACGTTTVLADPHEVANVAGEAGIRWMIDASKALPLRTHFAIPSCVPATSAALEWTGAAIDEAVVRRLAQDPAVLALGEVMDYQSLVAGDPARTRLVAAAREAGLHIEGHVPSLSGIDLSRYLRHGIGSDHTLATPEKIREELSKGVAVMLQEKSIDESTVRAVLQLPDRSRVLLVTDDVDPHTLVRDGHLLAIVRRAIRAGIPAVEAIAMATLRPAVYLGLQRSGGIAPGWDADFLLLDRFDARYPAAVYVGGRLIAEAGTWNGPQPPAVPFRGADLSVAPLGPEDFQPSNLPTDGPVVANAVRVLGRENSLTDLERVPIEVRSGRVAIEETEDCALVGVFARDRSSKHIGVIKGSGLRAGAFASSFAHDSHNLLVVGRSIDEMVCAANAVLAIGGGVAVCEDDVLTARLPLPIGGLLSDAPLRQVAGDLAGIEARLRALGVTHRHPFLFFSLLALTVSPRYKFSDRGIVDVEGRRLLPPFIEGPVSDAPG
jgi:adenine deaminase